ncbi:MXAN_6230/SCO0854 family RING domain-containing protein [Kitasatospora sp. NPDC088783]|uniref:MXAN_6230/SCO0854 family RING domain-containing protein n=1 Tax=Kitasatospora sp. NPDC088783 TaxID=3364077 RepID=UPI00381A570F
MTALQTAPATVRPARSPAAVMLARRGALYLTAASAQASEATLAGVTMLESDLLERGYLLSAPLRQALAGRSEQSLAAAGRAVLADVDDLLGADRDHTPLFRGFPATTPADTLRFWVDRVLTVWLQQPDQPCVLCGEQRSVHPVAPCAHLVCRSCFDGAEFSACPVCHRRIDAADPFLRPAAHRPAAGARRALPQRLRVLAYGGTPADLVDHAGAELAGLLARTGALSPGDSDDLGPLLDAAASRTAFAWLPDRIPARETNAHVLAWLLRAGTDDPAVLAAVSARLTTATDVLRLLVVRSGGDAGLVTVPRLAAVPRPLRRALLTALDALDVAQGAADLRRRESVAKHAGEVLHAFEHARAYPRAALVFAAVRSFQLTGDPLSRLLREAAAGLPGVDATGPLVRVAPWPLETALADGDLPRALALLEARPGELVRRTDHLLRLAGPTGADPVLHALAQAAPRVAPAVLLSALGALRTRATVHQARVFFPKGPAAKAYLAEDARPALAADVVGRAAAILTGEALARAAQLPPADLAVVDAELHGITAPFAERTASRALVTLPRGSELTLPDGRTLRLFVHWMESQDSGRTDLDLAAAMFDADWNHIGTCDYTSLRFARDAAVHSGDLTSAPAPEGASEFVDLDLDRLAAAGVRYVVAVVFSFNDVPFDQLADAFAGVMVRDEPGSAGPVFDARQVEQRYDLTAPAKASIPMVLDVAGRTLRWLDVVQGVSGTHHAVHRHTDALAALGRHLTGHFASGARVGLGEVALWHAAARATTVAVRHLDGTASGYRRRTGEDLPAFAARLGTPDTDPDTGAVDLTRAQLAFLLRGDLALPAGAQAYALHQAALDAGAVRMMTAADLVAALDPQ